MGNETYRVYFDKADRPTYFKKQNNGMFWCTHGNWEATEVGNTLQFSNGDQLPYIRYEDLTEEEHDEALYGS